MAGSGSGLNLQSAEGLLLLGIAGLVAYELFKPGGAGSKIISTITGAASAAAKAECSAVTGLACAYAQATYYLENGNSGEQTQLSGNVILPNGASIPLSTIPGGVQPYAGGGASFEYAGNTYYLNSPANSAGNWVASNSPNSNCAPSCVPTGAACCCWACCY